MKKIILLCCIILFNCLSITANAQSVDETSDIAFTEAGSSDTDDTRAIGQQIPVTREIIFYGIVAPPSKYSYSETINGVLYSGILTLSRFYLDQGNTVAVYSGILTAET